MRKIITKTDKEKKEMRNKTIIGLVLVVIMLFSTLGYSFLSGSRDEVTTEKIDYKGIEFIEDSGFWKFIIQGNSFLTTFNPKETENISAPVFVSLNNYAQKPLYFYEEKEAVGSGAKNEIARVLNNYVLRMQDVCYSGAEDCEENLPVKNCTNNMIIFKESDSIIISREDNCVFLLAPYDEQIRTADAFIFKILGIQ